MVLTTDRRHPRYAAPTDCIVVDARGRRLLGDRALDLSWTGIRVRGDARARPGEPVRVHVRIPDSSLWVDARGYVARAVRGRRRDDVAGAGICLTSMHGMSRVLLASVLRGYPLADPSARCGRDYASVVARIAAEAGPAPEGSAGATRRDRTSAMA